MKFTSTVFLALISTCVLAQPKMDAETLNKISAYESKLRKYQGELHLKTKQVKATSSALVDLNEAHSKLYSKHRKLIGDAQFLKYQNDELIEALKSADGFTPELASRFKLQKSKGRLPASVKKDK